FGLIRKIPITAPVASATERCTPGHPASSTRPQVKYQGHAAGPQAAAINSRDPRERATFGPRTRHSNSAPEMVVMASVPAPKADPTARWPTATPASRSSPAPVQPAAVDGVIARCTFAGD